MTRPEGRRGNARRRDPGPVPMRFLGIALSLALILVGILYPFDIHPENGVRWLDGGGLAFDGAGIAWTERLDLGLDARSADEITIEVWLRLPEDSRNWGPRNILALWDGSSPAPLVVGTQAGSIFLYSRYEPSTSVDFSQFHPTKRLTRGRWYFIAVRYAAEQKGIWLDGELVEERRVTASTQDPPAFSGRLVVGESPTTRRGIEGHLRGLAVYRRALEDHEIAHHYQRSKADGMRAIVETPDLVLLLPLDEGEGSTATDLITGSKSLEIPRRYSGLPDAFFDWARASQQLRDARPFDISVNIALFALFGWSLSRALRPLVRTRSPMLTGALVIAVTAAAFVLSLGLEWAQVLSPSRVADFADVLWNTVGGALGSITALAMGAATWRSR